MISFGLPWSFLNAKQFLERGVDIVIKQKLSAAHSFIHNHFNLERRLYARADFKKNRATASTNGVNWRPESASTLAFRDQSGFV